MWAEPSYLLKGLCLLAGYAFGCFLTADIVARCLAGSSVGEIGTGAPDADNVAGCLGRGAGWAVVAGDALKTVLACWFCYRLAAPELEHLAALYGGIGVVLGHAFPVWRHVRGGRAVVVAGTWLVLYLPVTGAVCCLAGGVAAAGIQKRAVGAVLAVTLAVPVAFLQFGVQSGVGAAVVALVIWWQCRAEFFPAGDNRPPVSRKKN